jgi:hypothetical protein
VAGTDEGASNVSHPHSSLESDYAPDDSFDRLDEEAQQEAQQQQHR